MTLLHKMSVVSLVVVGVTLGGCHVFKQKQDHRVAVVPVSQVDRPAPTLESLDARVTDIERRMAAARAANARAAAAARAGR
jgi:hypothetical protein